MKLIYLLLQGMIQMTDPENEASFDKDAGEPDSGATGDGGSDTDRDGGSGAKGGCAAGGPGAPAGPPMPVVVLLAGVVLRRRLHSS